MNLSHVATLQNEVKSCNLRADLEITLSYTYVI